jgi:hypothetical protein
MEKNAWFFGDSFTSGFGLNFDNEIKDLNIRNKANYGKLPDDLWDVLPYSKFNEYKENHKFLIWPNLVSKHYNLIYNNYGINGASNDEILSTIISQLKNINDGDYVFIGVTRPFRIMIPINNDIINKPLVSSGIVWLDNKITGLFNLENIPKEFYSDGDKEVIVNFLHDIVFKNQNNYISHFLKICDSLKEYFFKNNVIFFLWGYNSWDQYETIYDWTGHNVNDKHWSPAGHEKFAEKVITNINKNNYNIFKEQNTKFI